MSLVGRKVICRSNEPEPYLTGELVGFVPVSASGRPAPLVRGDDGGEWVVMGVVLPHSGELAAALDSMEPGRQWEWCAGLSSFLREIERSCGRSSAIPGREETDNEAGTQVRGARRRAGGRTMTLGARFDATVARRNRPTARLLRWLRKWLWCAWAHRRHRCWPREPGHWHCAKCHPCGEWLDMLKSTEEAE